MNEKLLMCKDLYIDKWGINNISRIIKHQVDNECFENPITSVLNSKMDRVIFFLVDGFGYTQYLWNNKYSSSKKKYTIDMNYFDYLSKKGKLNEFILGSSYISDTGAGLAEIFTGALPEDSNIYSSNYHDETMFKRCNIKHVNLYSDEKYKHNGKLPE